MNDVSYFIHYNLNAMQRAYDQLKQWLQIQLKKRQAMSQYNHMSGVNGRQAELLRMFTEQPDLNMLVTEAATRFDVSAHTARADLQHLVEMGLLREISLNKKTKSYIRVKDFDDVLHEL